MTRRTGSAQYVNHTSILHSSCCPTPMIRRELLPHLLGAARRFPVVTVTGPRQSGKTTLYRAAFPKLPHANFEASDTRAFATDDPRGFLRSNRRPRVLQRARPACRGARKRRTGGAGPRSWWRGIARPARHQGRAVGRRRRAGLGTPAQAPSLLAIAHARALRPPWRRVRNGVLRPELSCLVAVLFWRRRAGTSATARGLGSAGPRDV